ncbi:MAG: hypothetical protein J6F30_03420 [Cellulosilyticum sp.]|nr:hypothetical protein [Cellulosilyticum sp.]
MKQNIVRLMVLGVLIVLCIGQTAMLWLGDMSGHNFFVHNKMGYEVSYVQPKQVWCNIQGNIKSSTKNNVNSGIYKLESERQALFEELIKELRNNRLTMDYTPNEKYTSLLNSSQGIVYEFGTELTIDEIIGQNLNIRKRRHSSIKIKEIYVDLSVANAYKTYIYFIDEHANVRQKITLDSQLKAGLEVVTLYVEKENISSHEVYQASINSTSDSDFFVGNNFYPQVGGSIVAEGNRIQFGPVINDLESSQLENYVNYLFKNPSNKIINVTETGITYTDNINVSVRYNHIGTLEFQKTLLNNNNKLSDVERMSKINSFIETSGAIPDFLKKGIYLEDYFYDSKTGETIYRFGYRYEDGQIVVLSEQAKAQLEVSAFLELGIKDGEITSGKWIMLEPFEVGELVIEEMSSSEAINAIYENSGLIELETFKLDSLECAYILEDIQKESEFEWVGLYLGQPITTIAKIDNE